MSKLPGYGDTVICPYNKCHVILKTRIQTHLIKCAKQHPEIQLETCPFDVTHKLRQEEFQKHVDECPSRENFDRYAYNVGTSRNGIQSNQSQLKPTERKNWEDDDDWKD